MASCVVFIVISLSLILFVRLRQAEVVEGNIETRIIIDTDAGTDDAVAILTILGDPYYGQLVEGITCVRGNTEVDKVSINVLKVLKIANRLDIPVFVGAAKGYIESPDPGKYFGEDGMGDANYPETPPISLLQKTHAAEYLANIVNDHPGEMTILTLGPLTNIAIATRLNKNFMCQIKNIIGLSGSVKGAGYKRPNVEFNTHMDPHAAHITMKELFDAGRKMTVVPSEAVRDNMIDKKWRKMKLGDMNSKVMNFLNRIEMKPLNSEDKYWDTYDVYAAVVMMRPEAIIEMESCYVEYEIQGELSKGSLIVDRYNVLNKTLNANIVHSIDKSIIKKVCLENL